MTEFLRFHTHYEIMSERISGDFSLKKYSDQQKAKKTL